MKMISKEILKVTWVKDYEKDSPGVVIVEYSGIKDMALAFDEVEALKNAIIMLTYIMENLDKP